MVVHGKPADAVKDLINEKFASLMTYNKHDDTWNSFVCIVCDEVLLPEKLKWIKKSTLKKVAKFLLEQPHAEIGDASLKSQHLWTNELDGYENWMHNVLLSRKAAHSNCNKSHSCCGVKC